MLYLFSLVVFSLKNAIPSFFSINSYHGDLLYWLGDIVSLMHKNPPINFRTLDPTYNYHYFGALQVAAIAKTTGISAAKVALNYSYIEAMILLGLSALCLFKRIFKETKYILIPLFLCLFSTGFEKMTGVTFFWHIYQVPMSYNIALSLEMVIMLLLLLQLESKDIDYFNTLILIACLIVCTGTKGPSGAIILCGIGMMCIIWMFIRHEYKKALLYGVCAIGAWSIVYCCLLMPGNSTYLETATYVDPYKITLDNSIIINLKILFWKTIKYFRYILLINPWTFIPAGIYLIYATIKRKINYEDFIIFFMMVIGTVLGYVLHYYGNSEIYFTLSVFPFAAVLAGKLWMVFDESIQAKRSVWYKHIGISVIICINIAFVFTWNWKDTLQMYLRNGYYILGGNSPQYDNIVSAMTAEEYEAYQWIMDNTDYDALFLSDRMLEEDTFCYIPGAFSERYIYNFIEKDELEKGKEFFDGSTGAILYYIEKDIDYIIQNKRISPNFICPEAYGEKIYENNLVTIWQVERT